MTGKKNYFIRTFKNGFPFYPFLLTIYPTIFTLGHNIHEVYMNVAIRPIVILFLICCVVFLGFLCLKKSVLTVGLFTSWVMILFLNYGIFYSWLDRIPSFDLISRHRYISVLWLIFSLLGLWVLSKIAPSKKFTKILNWFAISLLIFPIIQITYYNLRIDNQRKISENLTLHTDNLTSSVNNPDVYIIVLDSYPRSDSLIESFNVNNQEFIRQLEEMGFYIASCARSNYAYTELSLSSMFNLNYLDQVAPEVIGSGKDTVPLFNLLKNSLMRRNFEQLGYSTHSIASYPPLAWENADYFHNAKENVEKNGEGVLTSFERMIFEPTILKIFLDLKIFSNSDEQVPFNYRYAEHLQQHQFTLKTLRDVVTKRGPKLVFTHITSPHAPFIFTPDGDLIPEPPNIPWLDGLSWEDHKKYFGMQVEYISNEMVPILKELISGSETKPIIVLFGDHGYANEAERMAVLSAVYAPDYVTNSLYPSVSLVNIFRIIFNQAYGGDYKILDDISYMSPHPDPFNFTIVEEPFQACTE